MYRIKFGDLNRDPRALLECDHVTEIVELLKSGVVRELIHISSTTIQEHMAHMESKLKACMVDGK